MIFVSKKTEAGFAVLGALVLLVILLLPESDAYYLDKTTLENVSDTLKGHGAVSDLVQDIIGYRAMVRQQNAYPILGSAGKELDLVGWDVVEHASTHPPTDFVMVAPIGFLPWPLAAMIWAWLMLALLACAFRIYGLPWLIALGLTPIALLWPPVSTSLGQFTIIWLLGFAIGYRYMRRNHFLSGVGIGLAAVTKIIPVIMIVLFLSKKRRNAIIGMLLVGLLALACVISLHPASIYQYIQVNQSNSIAMTLRSDNASLLGTSCRWCGAWGVILVFIFLALIFWANRRAIFERGTQFPTITLWMLLTYVSVVLLPVSWVYSLVPLLPVIVFLLVRRRVSTLFIGLLCLGIPFFTPIWGLNSVLPLLMITVLIGIGLIFNALPFRLFSFWPNTT